MRRNVLRFYIALFFFVLALALMQFAILRTPASPLSGFAVSDNRAAVVLTTFPLLALFLLGVLIILLILQPYSPVPRQRHFHLDVNEHHRQPAAFK
ncbi:MAG TPA: hypothetical protein VJK07_02990 [Candidatus Nanoarchaeia archaeon]|nr:hypothetical protein [Candidatus Nanoarchaeia archaeon]